MVVILVIEIRTEREVENELLSILKIMLRICPEGISANKWQLESKKICSQVTFFKHKERLENKRIIIVKSNDRHKQMKLYSISSDVEKLESLKAEFKRYIDLFQAVTRSKPPPKTLSVLMTRFKKEFKKYPSNDLTAMQKLSSITITSIAKKVFLMAVDSEIKNKYIIQEAYNIAMDAIMKVFIIHNNEAYRLKNKASPS